MKLVALMSRRELVTMIGAPLLGEKIIVIDRPVAFAALARRHPDPENLTTHRADLLRNAVDVGDNADDRRDLAHIKILHVDDKQRGALGIKTIINGQLSALLHYAVD